MSSRPSDTPASETVPAASPAEPRQGPPPPTLLCVCNYPANTGYAWDFIEGLYVQVARRLAARGVRTLVAYPRIDAPPRTLAGSPATGVVLDASLGSVASIRAVAAFVRREHVETIYFTDRPVWTPAYLFLRASGVRRIVVHDHSSGSRAAPTGVRKLIKQGLVRLPGVCADAVVAVSDYVARRQVEVGLVPKARVTRIWNGMEVPPESALPKGRPLHEALGLDPDRPAIACACRAAAEKGVPVLLRAFDLLMRDWPTEGPRPVLVYMGNGPTFDDIERCRASLASRDDIILTGYRTDAVTLVAGADVCAMPSLWQDALPLAVMQPMAVGRPVVASAVGGIPEMIADGETGLLVPPDDPPALAAALARLIRDPALRARFGTAARARVQALFAPASTLDALTGVVGAGFTKAS